MLSFARRTVLRVGCAVVFLCGTTLTLPAQESAPSFPESSVAFPPLRQAWMPTTPVVPYTAAEWQHGVGIYRQQAAVDQQPDVLVYPKDSILAATRATVRTWLATLNASEVKGLQLDPYGTLHVIAGQDERAQQIFAQRLAMLGMSLSDSAFTLCTAVQAFADADTPARLPIAEAYMARLDALPKGPSYAGASFWQFWAHQVLSHAYFFAGNPQATITHVQHAMALIPYLFFPARYVFYGPGGLDMYLTVADLLRSAHDTATLRTIDQQLLTWTRPPDSLVARDSSLVFLGNIYAESVRSMITLVAMLGQPAPTVVGTSWLNVADTGRHELPLTDGTVRIIGLGTRGQALTVLPAFSRLAAQFPRGFQPLFVLSTEGWWGTELVTPAQETANLRQYFTQKRSTTVPVAIWAGEKMRTPDGGLLPAPSPTLQGFHALGLPCLAIVDRHGTIRHLFTGFGRDDEAQAAAVIRMILNEGNPVGGRS